MIFQTERAEENQERIRFERRKISVVKWNMRNVVLKGSKVMEDDKRVFFLLLTEYSLSISSGRV